MFQFNYDSFKSITLKTKKNYHISQISRTDYEEDSPPKHIH